MTPNQLTVENQPTMNNPLRVILDRNTWFRGHAAMCGYPASALLIKRTPRSEAELNLGLVDYAAFNGHQCCVGQMLSQCGLPDTAIADTSIVTENHLIDFPQLAFMTEAVLGTATMGNVYAANDAYEPEMSDEARVAHINNMLIAANVPVEFRLSE